MKPIKGWSEFWGSPMVFMIKSPHEVHQWHRTDKYPDRCACGVDPSASNTSVVKRYVEPSDAWKFDDPDRIGECIEPKDTTKPSEFAIGQRVSLTVAAGNLYEQTTKDDDWFIEEFGVKAAANRGHADAPIAKIMNRRNGFYTWAPLSWLRAHEEPAPDRTLIDLLAIKDAAGLAISVVATSDLIARAPAKDLADALVRLSTWATDRIVGDWTERDGAKNKSFAFSEIRTAIAEVLRSSAHTIASEGLNGCADDVAHHVLTKLVHDFHMRPVKP